MVVALVDPAPRADVRGGQQLEQCVLDIRPDGSRRLRLGRARRELDAVARRLVGEEPRGDLADRFAVVVAAKEPGIRDRADDGMGELPPREDLLRSAEEILTEDRDHPLLRLRDHDLPLLQLLAQGHAVQVDVDAGAVTRHLRERGRQPGGAAVLERLDQPLLDQLDGDLDQLLAGERVADLHRGPLLGRALAELLAGEHAGAADPVSAGRGAVEDEQMAGRPRLRPRDAVGRAAARRTSR